MHAPRASDRRLAVGETAAPVPIRARARWNATGLRVEPGERYLLVAAGRWTDFYICTDADGYASDDAPGPVRRFLRRHEQERRLPDERWFALIGCVGERGPPFRIGSRREWPVPPGASGTLSCYANDVPSAYWNNWGTLRLTVTRLA
jgi:hypothetical protein